MSQLFGVEVVDPNENSTEPAFGFTAGGFNRASRSVPLSYTISNGIISGASLLSQVIVLLIARGLGGDFSARTLMWMQALLECFKRILNLTTTLYATGEDSFPVISFVFSQIVFFCGSYARYNRSKKIKFLDPYKYF